MGAVPRERSAGIGDALRLRAEPAGSLTHLAGLPRPGERVTLGVDNPLGTEASGAAPFLSLSTAPAPGFAAGLPLPGFGMGGPEQPGELLVDPTPGLLFDALVGPPWTGAGMPAPIGLAVPDELAL